MQTAGSTILGRDKQNSDCIPQMTGSGGGGGGMTMVHKLKLT